MSELFDAVDALLASRAVLPPPEERRRLRRAHGLTVDEVATALRVRRATVSAWESGRTEPRPPERNAYARLLDGLAKLYPAAVTTGHGPPERRAPAGTPTPVLAQTPRPGPEQPPAPVLTQTPRPGPEHPPAPVLAQTPRPGPEQPPAPVLTRTPTPGPARAPAPGPAQALAQAQEVGPDITAPAASTTAPPLLPPASPKAAPALVRAPSGTAADPRFPNGPLAVVDVTDDGRVLAHCHDGTVLDVPATSLPSLAEWALTEAGLGQPDPGLPHLGQPDPGLSEGAGPGQDADVLVVLTGAALERYGLPAALTGRRLPAGRIPESHKAVRQLTRRRWRIPEDGFGPWARLHHPERGADGRRVQLCLPSWQALDPRDWGDAGQLAPAALARLLGSYAFRVAVPRGSAAATGLALLTAPHPPGSPGAEPPAPAPCEAPDGHPVLAEPAQPHVRGPAERLFEEAHDWARPLSDAERTRRHLIGLEVNLALVAGAGGLVVGLGAPTYVERPVFDPRLPGSWLVDLSHVDLSRVRIARAAWVRLEGDRLPNPFTPSGRRPAGPAWYATPTVAYAMELGYDVAPTAAYVRHENGRGLDAWHDRLRDAYLATMAELGVDRGLPPEAFLAAMRGRRSRSPERAALLAAIEATARGGLEALRRPDLLAAIVSRARVGLHRRIVRHAAFTGQYPVAVLADRVVYAVDGESPLDFLPHREGKPLPGGFKLGVEPGLTRHAGTRTTRWGVGLRERHKSPVLNLARYVEDGTVTVRGGGA